MGNQELQKEIELLKKRSEILERIAIQLKLDPQTALYLGNFVDNRFSTSTSIPSQTYSASSPSGTAPIGSIWMEDTGVLATRKIHVYSGSSWVQMK